MNSVDEDRWAIFMVSRRPGAVASDTGCVRVTIKLTALDRSCAAKGSRAGHLRVYNTFPINDVVRSFVANPSFDMNSRQRISSTQGVGLKQQNWNLHLLNFGNGVLAPGEGCSDSSLSCTKYVSY